MTFQKKPTNSLYLAASIGLLCSNVSIAEQAPASMEEMWKIIQQQQKEIESLKAKSAQNEQLKQEVRDLKQAQQNSASGTVVAANSPSAGKGELERKTDVLASEVEKLKTQLFIPEAREYKSEYGLGPAASNVYRVNRGLSIGGYGEAFYTNYTDEKASGASDSFDLQRAVLYAGYKFNDWIILNNEIEFEHASTGEGAEEKGEVSVEFSQLDFLLDPKYNIRAGLMLVPMGFINEMHEPTTFHGNRRPDVERFIIPSTWREMGAGLFGEIIPGLQYRVYAMNGLNARSFESEGIREGRQGGSQALAEDFAFTGRVDYSPAVVPGLMVGGSAFIGNSGQNELYLGRKLDVATQLYEGHMQYRYRGLELRALGAWGQVNDTEILSQAIGETIGKESFGWYAEAAYDIMPHLLKDSTQYLAPFFRFEKYDPMAAVAAGFADNLGLDRWIYQGGLSYKPIDNIVIKADYRNIQAKQDSPANEFNLGIGFIY
ncbi:MULTISPECIES: porin family protein [Methylomonas]|uniref:hypothetical protein n=1 Tax=Methylomonas TaxID=416 RepID=UPI0012325617|nr:hypothetical protein [Methylomonas rhizoryzae]